MRDGDSRAETEIAVSVFLERGLSAIRPPVSGEQIRQLAALVSMLSQWAPRINLTGHRDPITMATRLVLDAAAMSHAVPELRAAASLADLGSGAGFPGIPIAILNPQLKVTLVDSRLKRNHFQRAVRRELDLPRVTPLLGRSDRVEARPMDIVVAQAMAEPDSALRLMQPWAKRGGLLILPASESAAPPSLPDPESQLEERSYPVPESDIFRKLWLIRLPSV